MKILIVMGLIAVASSAVADSGFLKAILAGPTNTAVQTSTVATTNDSAIASLTRQIENLTAQINALKAKPDDAKKGLLDKLEELKAKLMEKLAALTGEAQTQTETRKAEFENAKAAATALTDSIKDLWGETGKGEQK